MIALKNVSKRFVTGGETVSAVDGVSLGIEPGEFVALVGPSGSGKTTLLNLIGGLEQPTAGEIDVDGQNIARWNDGRLSRYRGSTVGYVFQTFNLLARYSVLRNITLPGLLSGKAPKERVAKAMELLKRVGLEGKEHYLPNKLSGGERQRVAIARALMNDPSIVLADEPTGNLDEKNAALVLDLLKSVCKERGATLVMVTHNPDIAAQADRIVELRGGKLAAKKGGTK